MKTSARFRHIATLERTIKGHTFFVDIALDNRTQFYNAWLYEDGYGISESMFGLPSEQSGLNNTETDQSFMGMIWDAIPEYANGYRMNRYIEDVGEPEKYGEWWN